MLGDTITAIATPPGSGAIAVIRVSGDRTFEIVEKIFRPFRKDKKLSLQKGYTLHFGEIVEADEVIDEVLVAVFHKPHSYTGEDAVEISCHGSLYIQQKIIELLVNAGARIAQPGEFTLRAYLNGKMDLAQAEAVADLISATSEAARKVAFRQLRGGVSNELKQLRQKLVDFASLIELELDFAEEDVEFADRGQLRELILEIKQKVEKLLSTFRYGNAIKNGIPVAIVGEPNVGKSTLLNLLLKEDRAIVSDIPGTTRDTIEDIISIRGILFRFIDTAGLRHTQDKIEALGIERTKEMIKKAEVVLFMVDARDKQWKTKLYDIMQLVDEQKIILVFNKIDLAEDNPDTGGLELPVVYLSAKYHRNVQQLEEALIRAVGYNQYKENEVILTNARHYEALKRADEAISRVMEGMDSGLPTDLLAEDVRQVMFYLGEISGEITTDELLGNIFANFCIGK